MMDYKMKALVLRFQARALREHANGLGSHAVDHSLSAKIRALYLFASNRAHDEADRLKEEARELEKQ